MPILLTTFGLLLILALAGVSQVTNTKNATLLTATTFEQFDESRIALQKALKIQAKRLDGINRPNPDKDPFSPQAEDKLVEEATTPDHFREDLEEQPKDKRTRRTSYLHVHALFCQDDPNLVEGIGKATFLVLQAYLKELYQGQEFYEIAKQEYPDLEEVIIKKWIQQAQDLRKLSEKEGKLTKASELQILDLEDNHLTYTRYKMFSGTSPRKKPRKTSKTVYEGAGYYTLSECISMSKSNQILSLWLAPKPLLMALFQNKQIVNDVLAWRRDTYNEIVKDKKQSTIEAKSNDFKLRFASSIALPIDHQFIDFGVSYNRVALQS